MDETQSCPPSALLQVDENQGVGRQLKAEAKQIEADLVREREEDVRVKQAMRVAVVESRSNVAVAAEKMAIEKREAAEVREYR